MERLCLRYADAERALDTLAEILREPYSTIVRDAAIQRFEYTFEAVWKFVKEYLNVKEGIICNSPKSCFREIFALGFLNENDTVKCLEMTDSRNETSHTYKEAVAQAIYDRIDEYRSLMQEMLKNLSNKLK